MEAIHHQRGMIVWVCMGTKEISPSHMLDANSVSLQDNYQLRNATTSYKTSIENHFSDANNDDISMKIPIHQIDQYKATYN
jgi:hypothetical protein